MRKGAGKQVGEAKVAAKEKRNSQASIKNSDPNVRSCLQTKKANHWLEEARRKPRPRNLFEGLWLEGELALCLAGQGAGKSTLATQIAESIARGRPIERFSMTANAQQVLYVDLELDSVQFDLRYSSDREPDGSGESKNYYRFSARFDRAEIDLNIDMPEGSKAFVESVLRSIENEIQRTGAKIVIIDSLDRFNGGIMRNRDLAFAMNRLRRIKAKYGLSMLVLAHAPRRSPERALTVGQTIAARTLVSFADSVFAIGECRWQDNVRYIKHIRSRSNDTVYTAAYVPTFRIRKEKGSFLSFGFIDYYSEAIHLNAYMDEHRLALADNAKRLRDDGKTNRQIALELEISLAAASRALHTWSPYDNRPTPTNLETASPAYPKTSETAEQARKTGDFYTQQYLSSIGLPDDGRHRDADIDDSSEVGSADSKAAAENEPALDISLGIHSPHVVAARTKRYNEYDFDPTIELDQNDIVSNAGHPMFGLKRSLDANGREIFVAREKGRTFKPKIWYRYTNVPGCLKRWENLYGDGPTGHTVTDVTHKYEPPPPIEE